jgi:hypothetical protein
VGVGIMSIYLILAAVAGAVSSSAVQLGSWVDRLRRVGAGSLVGVFCGPALADALGCTSDNYRNATVFLAAAIGALVLGGLLAWLSQTSFASWVKRLTGWETKPSG